MSKTLYHLATDEHGKPKSAAYVDGNGFRYEIKYDEPTEIVSDHIAKCIMETCHYYGLVYVHETRTRTGIEFDMKDARARALESLRISEKTCIDDYVRMQLEDRIRQNFPPLPPVGRALECCIKHKYNLIKAGIRPTGWEPPYHMEDPGYGNTPAVAPGSLVEMITSLQTQVLAMNQVIAELMKPKVTVVAPAPAPTMITEDSSGSSISL